MSNKNEAGWIAYSHETEVAIGPFRSERKALAWIEDQKGDELDWIAVQVFRPNFSY